MAEGGADKIGNLHHSATHLQAAIENNFTEIASIANPYYDIDGSDVVVDDCHDDTTGIVLGRRSQRVDFRNSPARPW